MPAAEAAGGQLQAEPQRQVREEVARLEATRTELATDVESMARHLESERNRLRDALTEILKWVDETCSRPTRSWACGPRPAAARRPAGDRQRAQRSSGQRRRRRGRPARR